MAKGLSASDWSCIRAAYEVNRYAAFAVGGDYLARNPGQKWRTRFDGRGFETTPDAGGWSWGLELIGMGAPACIQADGRRVEYVWSDALAEWYVNDSRGLEHGYTVKKHIGGTDLLKLTLAVRGRLRPTVNQDGRGITFVNANGTPVVNYRDLMVTDADGVPVAAWFELVGEDLRLSVDDRAARYPLTIDPIAQQAYLKASNTAANDAFGRVVAISGDTVVIGAYLEDSSATDSGAAYVFVRNGSTWSQQAYLKASNAGATDRFGISVAVFGDTAVVGAWSEDSNATGVNGDETNNSAAESGAAYVFVRSGTSWSQQAYLKASNTGSGDLFGYSVTVSGDTVVVGAYAEDSNATGVGGNQANNSFLEAGAAYVFARNGTTWSQQAYLKASNTDTSDRFGISVALSGDTLVVGALAEDSNATGVNGNQSNNSALDAGAAYVFTRSGTTWSQQAYLKASNTGTGDEFGTFVGIDGDTAVVSAYFEDSNATGVNGNQSNNSAADAGAAYVFVRSGGVWGQQAYLKASNTGANDQFGISTALSGDSIVVGAYAEDSNATGVNGDQANNSAGNSGAAYVFVRNGGVWSQDAYLKASNTGASDEFGYSVSAWGDTVVVGAQGEDSAATGVNGNGADNSSSASGAAYVFAPAVCPTLGDMNCDCVVDESDVEPFALALVDSVSYALAYPGCDIFHGDMQPDGNVDGGDVMGIVDLLVP